MTLLCDFITLFYYMSLGKYFFLLAKFSFLPNFFDPRHHKFGSLFRFFQKPWNFLSTTNHQKWMLRYITGGCHELNENFVFQWFVFQEVWSRPPLLKSRRRKPLSKKMKKVGPPKVVRKVAMQSCISISVHECMTDYS